MTRETETVLVNGEFIEMPRLSDADRWHAINEFVWWKLGEDCSDEDFDACAIGCRVLYRDDYDTGRAYYQIVDAEGHGDGTGDWHEAE